MTTVADQPWNVRFARGTQNGRADWLTVSSPSSRSLRSSERIRIMGRRPCPTATTPFSTPPRGLQPDIPHHKTTVLLRLHLQNLPPTSSHVLSTAPLWMMNGPPDWMNDPEHQAR